MRNSSNPANVWPEWEWMAKFVAHRERQNRLALQKKKYRRNGCDGEKWREKKKIVNAHAKRSQSNEILPVNWWEYCWEMRFDEAKENHQRRAAAAKKNWNRLKNTSRQRRGKRCSEWSDWWRTKASNANDAAWAVRTNRYDFCNANCSMRHFFHRPSEQSQIIRTLNFWVPAAALSKPFTEHWNFWSSLRKLFGSIQSALLVLVGILERNLHGFLISI